MSRQTLTAAYLSAGAAALAGLVAWGYHDVLPEGRALPGASVGGYVQPSDVPLGDWLERRRQKWLDHEVVVRSPEGFHVVTLGELGVEIDVAETLAVVRRHAQDGSVGARLRRAWAARQGECEIPLRFVVDPLRAEVALEKLAPAVFQAPRNARLDLENHERVADVPGRELDLVASVDRVRETDPAAGEVIELAARAVPAEVTSAMLARIDVSQVLASYETDFKSSGAGRASNVRLAATLLNGTVMAPGQTVSFNELVGPRRLERGFQWAPVIIDDELTPGVGGGTCQVASTLHAAAVMGALEVVQRRSHSRPSGYTKLGLDATVIYGEVDLKIRNPYPEPVIIHAFTPKPRTLRVELLGCPARGRVEYSYGVSKVHDFYRRVTTKDFLDPGRKIRRQRGIRGYDVTSVVRVFLPDGTVDVRHYFSEYRPTPEVYWVSPGYDVGQLPDLPQGASRLEVDGSEVAKIDRSDNPYAQDDVQDG